MSQRLALRGGASGAPNEDGDEALASTVSQLVGALNKLTADLGQMGLIEKPV